VDFKKILTDRRHQKGVFLAYQMALGEQGLVFYTDVEKGLKEAPKSVQAER
jgi:hypothetical protein